VEGADGSEVRVQLFREPPPPAGLAVVGCDPAFGILSDGLRRDHGIEVSWNQRGSRAALSALARGEAHVAGVHLHDPASGAWNGPWVREWVPFPCTRVSFAVWEQGLLVRPDAKPRIGGVGDLAAGGARLLNREEGSGSRVLLDEALAAAGVEPAGVEGYATVARGHLSVADGVAAGAADAGVAIRAAGRSRGLDVLPLREEAYELVIPDHFLDLPAVEALLAQLRRPGARAQVEALEGYDVASMGEVVE
jgi:putative molybdopterin biosynthesis protein